MDTNLPFLVTTALVAAISIVRLLRLRALGQRGWIGINLVLLGIIAVGLVLLVQAFWR